MTTAPDRPTRVSADLFESAAVEGARSSRSARQQIDHWARVGRAVTMTQTAARRRVEAAMAGELDERELSTEERTVLHAEIDAVISETGRNVSFGATLAKRGVTTVALDDDGVLTRYFPDGSTAPLT
jgi:hypothetical protein